MREAWTEAALAERLGISRQTVRKWRLPPHDVALGRSVGWWPETLVGWVGEHRPELAGRLGSS